MNKEKKYAIITDTNIEKLYRKDLASLDKRFSVHTIKPGETSKKLSTLETLTSKLLHVSFGKDDVLIAMGGGVVGDITGLLASLYMRGVDYIQVPTTLLAMCDSAIGGKTGVNTKEAKNILGTFYESIATMIEPNFLQTLPEKEIKNGLAEALKCGVIADSKLFKFIDQNYESLLDKNISKLNTIIERCVKLKRVVTQKDPLDTSIRKMLNYGHTIGHTLEQASNYSLSHGEAVSIGMCIENKLALNKKIIQKREAEKIELLCRKLSLPTQLPKRFREKAKRALYHDKKRADTTITLYLPGTIGTSRMYAFNIKEIEDLLI